MANKPINIDNELVKQVKASALGSLYYYPVGFDRLGKSKYKSFGNIIYMPGITNDLDIKCKHVNTYTLRIYYLGFGSNKAYKPENQILDKVEMKHLKAKKIVASSTSEVYCTYFKTKVIISNDVLNKKFGTNLTWVAFFGFDIIPSHEGKEFVYLTKDIKVNGAILKKYSVGIFNTVNTDGKTSNIDFIWVKEQIKVPWSDYQFFDPQKTGDLFLKKVCNVCQRLLSTKTFSKGHSCKDCKKIINEINAISKKRKEKKKNKSELKFLSCPVCEKTTIPKLTGKIALDHSHKDLHIRGWVCDGCNAGIGKFKDEIILFENALKFLKTD